MQEKFTFLQGPGKVMEFWRVGQISFSRHKISMETHSFWRALAQLASKYLRLPNNSNPAKFLSGKRTASRCHHVIACDRRTFADVWENFLKNDGSLQLAQFGQTRFDQWVAFQRRLYWTNSASIDRHRRNVEIFTYWNSWDSMLGHRRQYRLLFG